MEQAKEKVVDTLGFIQDVGEWLLDEKCEGERVVLKTLVGLFSYGITNEEELQNVADDKKGFADRLSPKGVPKAICDLLFEQYVAKSRGMLAGRMLAGKVQTTVKLETVLASVVMKLNVEGIEDRLTLPMFNDKIPGKPSESNVPNMLMYDLKNSKSTSSDVYKYLDETGTLGPSALFGTSGCGKTRSIFEFLSANYGFYFVCVSERNPGSRDMLSALQNISRLVRRVEDCGRRYDIAFKVLLKLVLSRAVTFSWLVEVLNRVPTAYEWLVAQLYPEHVFGIDVFAEFSLALTNYLVEDALLDINKHLSKFMNIGPFHLFVDEAQLLLRGPNEVNSWSSLFSSRQVEMSGEPRSMYSGVLRGLCSVVSQVGTTYLGYPKMAGTRLHIETAERTMGSNVAKENMRSKAYDKVFQNFRPLTRDGVERYVRSVIGDDLEGVSTLYKDHICEWLRGRPRWTATFLSLYLQKYRGKGHHHGEQLLGCLDEYLHLMTSKPSEKTRHHSGSLGSVSAYSLFRGLWKRSNEIFVRRSEEGDETVRIPLSTTVARAVLDFALSGKPVSISHKNSSEAIETGVCFVEDTTDYSSLVLVSEPIIVEAGVRFLGFEDFALEKRDAVAHAPSSAGFEFERFALPHILRELTSRPLESFIRRFDGGEVFVPHQYRSKKKIGRSAYGVLARQCQNENETMDWIEESLDSTLDGSVPPFCLPDRAMGSDLLVFLREENTTPLLSMWQIKFEKTTNVTSALRSVVPELQYHIKRESGPKPALKGPALKRWKTLFTRLFGEVKINKKRKRERGALSVVLQSAEVTEYVKGTAPGAVSLDDRLVSSELSGSRMNSDGPSDMQVVIHGDTLKLLVGDDLSNVIKKLKQ